MRAGGVVALLHLRRDLVVGLSDDFGEINPSRVVSQSTERSNVGHGRQECTKNESMRHWHPTSHRKALSAAWHRVGWKYRKQGRNPGRMESKLLPEKPSQCPEKSLVPRSQTCGTISPSEVFYGPPLWAERVISPPDQRRLPVTSLDFEQSYVQLHGTSPGRFSRLSNHCGQLRRVRAPGPGSCFHRRRTCGPAD